MDETLMKIRILTRAELALAQVHLQLTARRIVFTVVGLGLIVLTVAMLNLGLFHAFSERIGPAGAAFAIAAVNALLGGGILLAAGRLRPGPEERLVHEIRDMALSELSADAEGLKAQVGEVSADLARIRSGVNALTDTASGGLAGIAHLAPLLGMLVDLLKSREK
jgi:hypothetical protein